MTARPKYPELSKKEVTRVFNDVVDFCAEKLRKIDEKNGEIMEDIKKEMAVEYYDDSVSTYFEALHVIQEKNFGFPRNVLMCRVIEDLIRIKNSTVNYLKDIGEGDDNRIIKIIDKYKKDVIDINQSVSENTDILRIIASIYCIFLMLVDIFNTFGLDLTYEVSFWGGSSLADAKNNKIKNIYTHTVYNLFKDSITNLVMSYIYYNYNNYKQDIDIVGEIYDIDKNKTLVIKENNRIRYAGIVGDKVNEPDKGDM